MTRHTVCGKFMCLILLTAGHASSQECESSFASLTGYRAGIAESYACSNDSYITAVWVYHTTGFTDTFTGFKVSCSNGDVSPSYGEYVGAFYKVAECPGGLTQMSTSPSLDYTSYQRFPTEAYFFCYSEDGGYPAGTNLGPFP